ncbi:Altered inheritance of mitochondria protein 6 [Diaporthe eres]
MMVKLANESHNSSFIFVLTFLIKPSSIGVIPHDFISTNPITTYGQPIGGEQKWLDDFSHTVKSRACHSHNDYLRPYPLFSALAAGCSSVEADVWLTEDGKDLLVGHDEGALGPNHTLTSMYLDPLLSILDSVNVNSQGTTSVETSQPKGVFRTEPNATLVLLIDVKTRSSETWPLVVEQLSALRDKRYLARYEDGSLMAGPITVVGSGNIVSDYSVFNSVNIDPSRPFDEYHDTFLDAPLSSLPQATDMVHNGNAILTTSNEAGQVWTNKTAYYASASFKATIGSVITGFTPSQLSTLRSHIATARELGLKSRYWDTPDWPVGFRDYVWGVLQREGVGVLNVDDLEGAARGGWDAAGQAWARDAAWMVSVGVWAVCCGIAVVALGWKRRRVSAAKYSE